MLPLWLPVVNRFFSVEERKKETPVVQKPTYIKSDDVHEIACTKEGELLRKKHTLSTACRKVEPIVLVHGGAGNIPDYLVPLKLNCVKKAATAGYRVMRDGGSSVEAVEAAIRVMEDDPIMNAGRGSVLNYEGEVETDACIMSGESLEAGGVTAVKNIAHPISLAKLVMEKSPHVLLAGTGAVKFAQQNGIQQEKPGSLVTVAAEEALREYKQNPEGDHTSEKGDIVEKPELAIPTGSVGVVAMDKSGHMAVGLSTGGVMGKMPGRVGDSPQIGKGAYCDDELGGVAVTGHGESIAKLCLSSRIIKEIELGKKASEAIEIALVEMEEKFHKKGGAICISRDGNMGVYWTTQRMPWAYLKGHDFRFGIDLGNNDIWPRTESVGAIAIDRKGHIAVGASSGGWNGKSRGKFNEACSIGGGIYADNAVGAVSLTGYGKYMMRMMLALQITKEMEHKDVKKSCVRWLDILYGKFEEHAGVVGVNRYGDVAIHFNTDRMPWAYQRKNILHYGIDLNDEKRDITC